MMSRTTTMPILSQIIFMQCRVQQLVHPIPNYSIAMPCTVIRSIRSKITVMQCRAQLYGISDQKLQVVQCRVQLNGISDQKLQ